jgi:hypothetical protein
MKETIIGGIILAIITGLCWLAYTHPKPFKSLASAVGYILFLIHIAWRLFAWGGNSYLWFASKNIPKETMDGLKNGFASKIDFYYDIFLVGSIAVGLYGLFLWNFVAKLKNPKENEKERAEEKPRLAELLAKTQIEANKKKKRLLSSRAQALRSEIDRIKFDAERAASVGDNERAAMLRSELSSKTAELDEIKSQIAN